MRLMLVAFSCTLPMGCYLPQRRHQLLARPPRPGMVRSDGEDDRAQAAVQSAVFLLPQPHHGRRAEHDPALPQSDPPQHAAGEGELQASVTLSLLRPTQSLGRVADTMGRCHIFYSQRVMDIPDGIPKWTKIDKTSELIEDSPPEMVQELERQRKKQMDTQIQNREVTMDQ